jgi:hypothetical protein
MTQEQKTQYDDLMKKTELSTEEQAVVDTYDAVTEAVEEYDEAVKALVEKPSTTV